MPKTIKTLAIWLCSLALLAPATGLLTPAFAAATVTTTTSLASATNPVDVGAPTVLTATVTGTAPTGNVTFKNSLSPIEYRASLGISA